MTLVVHLCCHFSSALYIGNLFWAVASDMVASGYGGVAGVGSGLVGWAGGGGVFRCEPST